MPAYQDDASLGFWTWTCNPSVGEAYVKNLADGLSLGESVTRSRGLAQGR